MSLILLAIIPKTPWCQLLPKTNIKFELLYKPDAQISWVDIDDVAEAVASILTRPYHLGGTYELCGTDIPISCINIVKEIGDLSKKKIKFTNMPHQKIKNGLSKNKYNTQQLINQKLYYDFINENRMRAGNSKVLTMLLQRPPNSFKRAFKRKYQP